MNVDNMKLWDAVKRPPETALKAISGGRLKGMTDIKPQWRYQAITEQLGPCGIGWKYEIKNTNFEAGNDGQVAVFVEVALYIKLNGEWSDPIPGTGGSMYIAKETSGLRVSDEAVKMATTDALSVAMKYLGFGSDVYMGMFDGSKYREEPAPKVTITAKQKEEFAAQIRACLTNGDEHGIRELWAEWGADEKAILWSLFNSQERSAMKAMKAAG